jgi:hypothetical protein
MAFIQIIEMKTSRIDEVMALVDDFREATEGKRTAVRATFTADRDNPGTYLQLVEFDSYEDAMVNSALSETSELAGKLADLCDEAPTFRNLDVERVEGLA